MMTEDSSDERSTISIALEWSTRVTTIGLEMVLPVAGGYWIDRRLGTTPLLIIVGALLGFVAGMYQLWRIARPQVPKTK